MARVWRFRRCPNCAEVIAAGDLRTFWWESEDGAWETGEIGRGCPECGHEAPTSAFVVVREDHRPRARQLAMPDTRRQQFAGSHDATPRELMVDPETLPTAPCYACLQDAWYQRTADCGGGWTCMACHPDSRLKDPVLRRATVLFGGPAERVYGDAT